VGTEAFWVPLVLSAVGTGAEAVNQRNANNRAQGVETQNIIQQQQLENEANVGAKNLTRQIANSSPAAVANKQEGAFVQNLRQNEAGASAGGSTTNDNDLFGQSTSGLPSSTVGSSRFKQDNATAQTQVNQYGSDLAKTMSNINAPVIQRQEEGLGMQDYATGLNLLQGQSQGENFVNQLRAEAAGQANPYVSAIAGMFTKGANAYSKNTPFPGSTPGSTNTTTTDPNTP
jgi:hypothetical protein